MAGNDVVRNPGFAASGVSPQQYIANVIQGEAASPAGQFAVASVINNRTESSIGGFGNNVLETAGQGGGTPYPQFSGYQNAPVGGTAYNLAGQLLNGNLSQSGDPGNALYYNNASTGAYGNSGTNVIGGNYFSDQYGTAGSQTLPSNDFRPPSYDPGASGSVQYSIAQPGTAASDALQEQSGMPSVNNYSFAGNSGPNGTPPNYIDGGTNDGTYAFNNSPSYNPAEASGSVQYSFAQPENQSELPSVNNYSFAAQSAPDGTPPNYIDGGTNDGTYTFNNLTTGQMTDGSENTPDTGTDFQTIQTDPSASNIPNSGYDGNSFGGSVTYAAPSTPDSGAATSTAVGSMTIPMAIDAQTRGDAADTTAQDKAISSAADSTNKTNQADTKAVTGTLSGIASMFDASGKNLFVRAALIILGLTIVAFGIYSMAKSRDLVPKAIPVPV